MKVIKIVPHPAGEHFEWVILAWPEQAAEVEHHLQDLAQSEAEAFAEDSSTKRTITVELVEMSPEEILTTVEEPSEELRRACEEAAEGKV